MASRHEFMTHESPVLTVPVDLSVCVIPFAVGKDGLEVALVPRALNGTVALPTGMPAPGEALSDAASRIAVSNLKTEPDYLEQLYTFSVQGARVEVIVAYFALISADTRQIIEHVDSVTFVHVESLDPLSDVQHGIVDYAKTRLRAKLGYSNVGFYLLPREFTLSELQEVYESVIDRRFDKRNFRRRILAAGFIEPLGQKRQTSHRPATLYRFTGEDTATGTLTPSETDWSS